MSQEQLELDLGTEDATETPEATQESLVNVASLDAFTMLLGAWHENAVATVKHLATMPEGMEVQIEGEDSLILSGDAYRSFLLGLSMSLDYLGTLPFAVEYAKVDEPQTAH